MTDDSTTITRAELIDELRVRRMAVGSEGSLGISMVSNILTRRPQRGQKAGPGVSAWEELKNERIDLAELAGALIDLGVGEKISANTVFRWVLDHREPDWQNGDVVMDARGFLYKRVSSGPWVRFGSGQGYPHGNPVRPLKLITREVL